MKQEVALSEIGVIHTFNRLHGKRQPHQPGQRKRRAMDTHNDPMKINQAAPRFAERLRWLSRNKARDVQQARKKRQKR